MKKVSVLIPVYNRKTIIEQTITAALSQTYDNFEIIIVDNASTDGTWEILQNISQIDDRVKIFRNSNNIGPVKNWLRCVEEAAGEYGKILWSDDLISPEFLDKTVPYLDDNEDVGFVFTGTEIFVDGGSDRSDHYFIGKTGLRKSDDYIRGIVGQRDYPVSPGCALFRLNDIRKNLLVDIPNSIGSDFASHAIGNDLLLFLLTAKDYKYFAFINDKLSFFRSHKGSISIQSSNGKLPLHYDLALAYFVERYRPDMIGQLNARLLFDLKRFPACAKYGMKKVGDFYMVNKVHNVPAFWFLWLCAWRLTRKMLRYFENRYYWLLKSFVSLRKKSLKHFA